MGMGTVSNSVATSRLRGTTLKLVAAVSIGAIGAGALADDEPLAVNFVAVDDRLHTAGQPQAETLRTLAARGYEAVINLAPPAAQGAVATERQILEESGVVYTNIPVDWQNPEPADFERFQEALAAADGRRVLVHCQMNMRASMFTFLHRVIDRDVPLDEALATLEKVWSPQERWADFGETVLASHGIEFEFPSR